MENQNSNIEQSTIEIDRLYAFTAVITYAVMLVGIDTLMMVAGIIIEMRKGLIPNEEPWYQLLGSNLVFMAIPYCVLILSFGIAFFVHTSDFKQIPMRNWLLTGVLCSCASILMIVVCVVLFYVIQTGSLTMLFYVGVLASVISA